MESRKSETVACPVCSRQVTEQRINEHLDNGCSDSGTSKIVSHTTKKILGDNVDKKSTESSNLAPIFGNKHHDASQVLHLTSGKIDQASSSKLSSRKRSHASTEISQNYDESESSKKVKVKTSSRLHNAAPLAERLRPQSLSDFVGQSELTRPGSLLMNIVESGSMGSIIFWGPPGCGKTTLARLLAKRSNAIFKELSATMTGTSEVRALFEEAKGALALTGRRTTLFLDEIHRFNKAQQDIFLPYVEQGLIQLIGATTENPSFKVNCALLSRCRVFVLERLTDDDISEIVTRAIQRTSTVSDTAVDIGEIGSSQRTIVETPPSSCNDFSSSAESSIIPFPDYPHITYQILQSIISLSTGDARTALSLVELALSASPNIQASTLLNSLRRSVSTSYDRTGDSHYDMISALHKSVRGSQGSAALYWLARMLTAGEDPVYIARRMVVCSSEDIGLADNHALPLAMATLQACQVIGMPECRINLAHLIAYLSEAPKSTRSYEAYNRAEEAAKQDMTLPVPMQIRNAPTSLMRNLGYSRGYAYNPDYAHPVTNDYLPIQFRGDIFLRKEGDPAGKIWDEEALMRWELEENDGEEWEGRRTASAKNQMI